MSFFEIFLLSLSLASDAFSVSICKGLSISKIKIKDMLLVGLYFGIFQGFMPLLGYIIGSKFSLYIVKYDHFIALVLLSIIGINMIRESFNKDNEVDSNLSHKNLLLLAIATSIDAFTIGITFSFLNVDVLFPILSISIITFILSFIGVKIGNIFGSKYKSKSEFLGGLLLIILGIKIFLKHI